MSNHKSYRRDKQRVRHESRVSRKLERDEDLYYGLGKKEFLKKLLDKESSNDVDNERV